MSLVMSPKLTIAPEPESSTGSLLMFGVLVSIVLVVCVFIGSSSNDVVIAAVASSGGVGLRKDPLVTAKSLSKSIEVFQKEPKEMIEDTAFESSYQDYQNTFERPLVVLDTKKAHNFDVLQSYVEPLRRGAKRTGLSIDQFVDSFQVQLPTDMIEFAHQDVQDTTRSRSAEFAWTREQQMVAQEALQPIVWANKDYESVQATLEDILSARTEASNMGMILELPQKQDLLQLAQMRHKVRIAGLAKTILSRS